MGNAIRVSIDAAGRLVIPKALREQAGIEIDVPLEISCRDGRIEIQPAPREVRIIRKGRLKIAVPVEPSEPVRSQRSGHARCYTGTTGLPHATAVDTSVIVAGLLAWHQRHPEANAAIESVLVYGKAILPAPALVEAFSVMTRLPAPHRLSRRLRGCSFTITFGSTPSWLRSRRQRSGERSKPGQVWALLVVAFTMPIFWHVRVRLACGRC